MRYILTVVVLFCAFCHAQTNAAPLPAPAPAPVQEKGGAQPEASGAVLQGTVGDSTGAMIVGATVTLTGEHAATFTTTSDAQGKFILRGITPGSYTIVVTSPKFQEFKTEFFTVSAGEDNELEAQLQPAVEKTQVEVVANTQNQVETEAPELSGTISAKEIQSIPLNGNNFSKAMNLVPGVSDVTGQDEAKVGVQGSAKYSVNGGRVEYNSFEVDGTDVLNTGIAASRGQSTFIVYPSLEAIQEMKVLTSSYGAEYGRSASGTVLITTKSGGQAYHGSANEFFGNNIFNARGFLDPPGSAPTYQRNQFGFTVGGPFTIPKVYNNKRDQTFFYFSEEARLERSPEGPGNQYGAFSQAVPSLNERLGNFSDVCPAVTSGVKSSFNRSQYPDCPSSALASDPPVTYPGNMVPRDPVAQAILSSNLIPAANSSGGCAFSLTSGVVANNPATWPCYNQSVSPSTYWREELFRIDHNLSPTLKASFSYVHDAWNTTVVTPQWQYGGLGLQSNSFPTVLNNFTGPGVSLSAHLIAIRGATLVNDYSVGFVRSHITLADAAGPGADLTRPAALAGMGYLFPGSSGGKIPGIYIGGSNSSLGGVGLLADTSYMPWSFSDPTISVRDNLSKVLGRHTLQVGVLIVEAQQTEISSATGGNTGDVQGLAAFSNVSNPQSTGNSFADYLVAGNERGTMQYFAQDSAQHTYTNRYWTMEPYVQDDWQATSRLHLNYGIRMSLFGNWTPTSGTEFNFIPSQYNQSLAQTLQVNSTYGYLQNAPNGSPIPINTQNPNERTVNGLVACGSGGVPDSCMRSHIFNPAPRVGFAWDPAGDGKTSIRGGYGLFFEHGTAVDANSGSLIGSAPRVLSMTELGGETNNALSWECIGGVGANCPNPAGAAYPINVVAIPTKAVWPYAQQWSLSVQRELNPSTVATLAYVGSKGTHLTAVQQLNQLEPVSPLFNAFGPHEPITADTATGIGVCTPTSASGYGSNLQGYQVASGYSYFPGSPGYQNLQVACSAINPNSVRRYPGYGQIDSIQNIANSSYNALQLTLTHTSRSLNTGLVYTWGHSIDEASDRYEAALGNSLDIRSNRASSDFDQRHLLTMNYLYKLPLVRWTEKLHEALYCNENDAAVNDENCAKSPASPPYKGVSKHARAILENWELSGITTVQTGTPFSIINGGSSTVSVLDNAGVANGLGAGSYPDVVRSALGCGTASGSGIGPLLGNPCRFVAPRGLTFGNAGRNFMNNPNRINFDMAIAKRMTLPHEGSLELRMDAFNLFNTAQYRIYDPARGNTASNTITCYGFDPSTDMNYSAGAPSCLANNQFLRPVDAHRPRILQFSVKVGF